jgi:hypothetical protein
MQEARKSSTARVIMVYMRFGIGRRGFTSSFPPSPQETWIGIFPLEREARMAYILLLGMDCRRGHVASHTTFHELDCRLAEGLRLGGQRA